MQYNDSSMTPAGNLQLIESMINQAKNKFTENGHIYLIWGWTVLICSLGHFILLQLYNMQTASQIWMLTWVTAIYQIVYSIRKKKKEAIKTYTDDIVGFIWLTFIVSMVLVAFIIARAGVSYFTLFLNPLFLTLYGIPTFLSGIVLRLTPLKIGGISCWLLAVLACFIPYDYQLLLLAAAMVAAWIIPGYALQSKFKKQQ